MVVQHNITAMNANRQLGIITNAQAKSTEKLSSGYRINRAADDAAGLTISEKMRSQIRGLNKASSNAQDGISLIQTAEGALNETESILQRMRELSVQAANGTETDEDREAVQSEISQLQSEITRISETTQYNTMNLLDGSLGSKSASSQGTTLTGSNIATFKATTFSTADIKAMNLSAYAAGASAKDTFEIDGETFEVDWSEGDAKKFIEKYGVSYSSTNMTSAQTKAMASDLQELLNKAASDAGISGTVSVKYGAEGVLHIASDSNGEESSFGFVGTTASTVWSANQSAPVATDSFGALLAGKQTTNTALIKDATMKVNSTIASQSKFMMNINGTAVMVSTTGEIAENDTLGSVASQLQTDIQTAVSAYNDASGDQLQVSDFTVTTNKDGSLSVNYIGDKEVSFSFGEYTDPSTGDTSTSATKLGLINKQSASATQSKGMQLQIGANEGQTMKFTIDDMSAEALGVAGKKVDLSKQSSAEEAITTIDAAIKKVSSQRSSLGAVQNRLEHTIANLDNISENTQSAESSIRDVDMASEMVEYSKNNILAQAGQSMLAQANQSNQGVLSLLG